jgi:hypothetical protein
MKKLFILILVVLIGAIVAIKTVPKANEIAREHLPDEILTLIGEDPKNIFEKGIGKAKDALNGVFE